MGWNARWLQNILRRRFAGDQVVVVSNREPCVHDLAADGSVVERHPASGLVTALDPVLRVAGGTWVAHGSGSADRATVDSADRLQIAGDEGAYTLRRVWLTRGQALAALSRGLRAAAFQAQRLESLP
jgi:trehalose 6-phosphate synthase